MDGLTRCLKMFVFHTTKPKFSLDINKNALNMNIEKNSLKCAAFSNEEKKRRSSNEINIDNWYTVTGFEKLFKMKNGDFWELRNYFYGLEIFHLDHTAFCIVYLILNWTAIMHFIVVVYLFDLNEKEREKNFSIKIWILLKTDFILFSVELSSWIV